MLQPEIGLCFKLTGRTPDTTYIWFGTITDIKEGRIYFEWVHQRPHNFEKREGDFWTSLTWESMDRRYIITPITRDQFNVYQSLALPFS